MTLSPGDTATTRSQRQVRAFIVGVTVDAVLLAFLLEAGVAAGAASMVSLLLAGVVMYPLGMRAAGRGGVGWFAVCVLLAVLLRGGVLAWMERIPGCPVVLTAGAAAAAAGCVMWAMMAIEPGRETDSRERTPACRNPVTVLLIYAVLLRLVYLGLPELIHEEAYYWNYSRHPALSYLDHPPMVAWLIRGFTAILGHTELGVRAGAFASWLVGAWFVSRLTRRIYGPATAARALLLFAVLPVYFLIGLIMSPDAPLTACWVATLYFSYRSLIDEDSTAWYGAGVFLGLGMLSKYTIVLLGFAVLAFMLVDRRSRRWFLRPSPWTAAGIALLLFSPVIVWNFQHHWMSFAFQTVRRSGGAFDFNLPSLLGTAALLITPVGLAAVAVAAVSRRQLAPAGNQDPDDRFARGFRLLMLSTLLPFAVFVVISLSRHTKLNWTAPLWLGALPFMAHMMATGWPSDAGRWRAWLSPRTWRWTVIVLLLLLGAAMHYFVLCLPGLSYPENDLGLPGMGWLELAEKIETAVDEVGRESGVRPLVVGLNSDRLSSWLAFYRSRAMARGGNENAGAAALDTAGPNLFGRPRSNMYGLWFPSLDEYRNRPMILVGDRPDQLDVPPAGREVGPVREITTEKNGQVTWRVYYRILGPKRATKRGEDG